jgi:riboflavin kinase/FMN adenylyltransferase
MKIHSSIAAAGKRDGAVTIGAFDGVHLGHRRLISTAHDLAVKRGAPTMALTFWPHPARVLAPALAPPLISCRSRRRELLAEVGVEELIEQHFDSTFAHEPAEAFEVALLDGVGVREVVVGYDFTYGRGRTGNTETLRKACAARGANLVVVPAVTVDGLVVSSTKVREFVLSGNVEAASSLLGRPFDLEGPVVTGAGRGRTLGVPTANVAPETDGGETTPLLPGIGVYATRVRMPDGSFAAGACNVGVNPTFQPESTEGITAQAISVEVFILDRSEDLYGKRLRVEFVARLRPERRFATVQSLVDQIQLDIVETRRIISGGA